MDCRQVLDRIDAVAAGDAAVTEEMRAHLESCTTCAAELASLRRMEAWLESREAPTAPARFTTVVIQRIRRERWSAEQHVDWLFNGAMVFASLVVVGGIAALMNLSGVLAGAGILWDTVTVAGGEAAREAAPALVTYVAAAGLLLSVLAMWWWAERRLSW